MEIYLIRHTTPDIQKGICYGQADIPLAATYAAEKKDILDALRTDLTSVKIYSSPLQRCRKLAEDLFDEVEIDDRLMELNFGDWELKEWNAIEATELDPWMKDFVHYKVPGGESYVDLETRALEFLEELKTKNFENVHVVTHAGVIRALVAHALRLPLKDSFRIKLAYGAVIKIAYNEEKFTVKEGLVLD